MHIVNPELEKYIASLRVPKDPVFSEMERIAKKNNFPIVGPEVGRLLHILARFAGATSVLELGSGYGYSAIWLAKALPDGGVVHCTDGAEPNREKALEFFDQAGVSDKIRFHVGDALTLIETIDGPFDIVFNDIDKEDYPSTVEKVLPKLRQGGLFITDNTLWDGKVAEDGRPDSTTRGVLEFNRMITSDDRLETVILPIRDGLAVCLKK